jgi:hypothetical protein
MAVKNNNYNNNITRKSRKYVLLRTRKYYIISFSTVDNTLVNINNYSTSREMWLQMRF